MVQICRWYTIWDKGNQIINYIDTNIKRNIKKEEKLMGFWKEVDIEIRSRMNTFKTSYEEEKGDAIKIIANERYGKK